MGRVLLSVVAVLATLVSAVGVLVHYWTPGSLYSLTLAAFSPYFVVGGIVGIVGFAILRTRPGWIAVGVAAALVVWQVALQAPLFVAATAPHGRAVVVMTANLRLGSADPRALVATVRRHHVDILMLEELTLGEQVALHAAGLDESLPHHCSDPRDAGSGTGLWSRYPISDARVSRVLGFSMVTARIEVPGLSARPSVVALHVFGPHPESQFSGWHSDLRRLPAILQAIPADGPVLVGGDFNSTPDVAQFRTLLRGGYADAASQAGAGITATYPGDTWFGPLIAIDHVLTRGAVATRVDTVSNPGSDHRALIATVVLPT